MSVDVGTVVVSFSTKLDVGNVFQANDISTSSASHDDVFKLAHVVEQSVVFDIDFVDTALDSTDR